jgi:hypothetical protein
MIRRLLADLFALACIFGTLYVLLVVGSVL